MKQKSWIIFSALVALLIVSRLIPHPANFTALTAVALFSGSYFAGSHRRFMAPFAALFLSDLFFGFYPGIEINYLAVALCVLLSPRINANVWTIGVRSVAASVVFFVVSNLGVWFSSGLYPQTLEGLQTCFVMAVPFYPATFSSALIYAMGLYSVYRLFVYEEKWRGFLNLKYG